MIDYVDVVAGLCWGDEGKGKIVSHLCSQGNYDIVARWGGGSNAGHTVFIDKKKYKTHIIPSGIFHGVKSIIGPGCVLHPESFFSEIQYLEDNGFDTSLIKVSPYCHIVTDDHISFDKNNLAAKLGTTGKGIAPCYASKAARTGILAKDVLEEKFIWDEKLKGKILCEGAQGVWLDINQGLYPYVTSSETLPHAACSIGFPIQKIRNIWGCAKIYDTKSGKDPRFPKDLLDVPVLKALADLGEEFGVTTGRRRKVNWLNLDLLIKSLQITGSTHLVINKCDIMEELGIFKLFHKELMFFVDISQMKAYIEEHIRRNCPLVNKIIFSSSPEVV
jgi:adenylosuccinate synthase